MFCVKETTLTFFVAYLSPLKPKACTAKIDFWTGSFENLSFKIAMSWAMGVESPKVYLSVDLLKTPSIMPLGIFLVYYYFLETRTWHFFFFLINFTLYYFSEKIRLDIFFIFHHFSFIFQRT